MISSLPAAKLFKWNSEGGLYLEASTNNVNEYFIYKVQVSIFI